jgi:predicted aminopeptidase
MMVFFFSCSRLSYLTQQAPEQIKLMISGEENEELIKGNKVSEDIKRKLRLIRDSKAYFEKTLGVDTGSTYEKTILLNREAVSYLGIRSKINKISSIKECFPIFGCFPYLGFFNKSEGESFLASQEGNISTYLRPVYAYSSLGKYSDRVLSPFFRFSDRNLAELIFHELFHHVLFIKSEVTVNENLATFFAKLMANQFFKEDEALFVKNSRKKNIKKKKRVLLVEMIKGLNKDDLFRSINSKKESQSYIQKQIEQLNEQIKMDCENIGYSNCLFRPLKWNAARLSEYHTYQSKQGFFEELYNRKFRNLKSFFDYLVLNYKDFQKTPGKKTFIEYLKSR